jgi:hypothetical protein
MGYTENKILITKVWQKPNTYQLNCACQTLLSKVWLGTKQMMNTLCNWLMVIARVIFN